MRPSVAAMAAMVLLAGGAAQVHGGTITYTIQDIGTSTGYFDYDLSHTFAGTGFVGMYGPNDPGGESFGHVFGLEHSDLSRTEMEVDTSALTGATIQSAVLSFYLRDGSMMAEPMTVTSFATTGALSYQWDPTTPLGSITATANGRRQSLVDVTSLLTASVSSGSHWFGLNLHGSYFYEYGSTWDRFHAVVIPDRATVRLSVTYATQGPSLLHVAQAGDPRTADWGETSGPTGVGVPSWEVVAAVPEPATLASAALAVAASLALAALRSRN